MGPARRVGGSGGVPSRAARARPAARRVRALCRGPRATTRRAIRLRGRSRPAHRATDPGVGWQARRGLSACETRGPAANRPPQSHLLSSAERTLAPRRFPGRGESSDPDGAKQDAGRPSAALVHPAAARARPRAPQECAPPRRAPARGPRPLALTPLAPHGSVASRRPRRVGGRRGGFFVGGDRRGATADADASAPPPPRSPLASRPEDVAEMDFSVPHADPEARCWHPRRPLRERRRGGGDAVREARSDSAPTTASPPAA